MSEADLSALVEDIRQNGLLEPIVLLDGQVLDGKNRLLACEQAGVKPRFDQWHGKGSPISWVISTNLARRHLTPSQRAAVALEILPLLEQEAKQRQRDGGKVAKNGATLPTAGKASEFAAKVAGANPRYVEAVKAIQQQAPELVDEIRAGTLNVPEAKELAKQPQTIRQSMLRKLVDAGPDGNLKQIAGLGRGGKGITAKAIIGDSNHRKDGDRYYTELREIDALLGVEMFSGETLDPCAGDGRIVRRLQQKGCKGIGTDIQDGVDFFATATVVQNILTNPPWGRKDDFILHAMKRAKRKIALLLPLFALSGVRRLNEIYSNRAFPLKCVYVISHRLQFDPNADGGSTIVGGWFVWERGYRGEPVVRWLP